MDLATIERRVIETLNRLSCPITKAICNVESNISIKNLLADQSLKNEKLNLLIWLITRFESQLALEFVDSDYLEIDIKTKKVLDALNLIGIIDANQYTVEKFHQVTAKSYKEILLIIESFVKLVDHKLKQSDSLFDNLTLASKQCELVDEQRQHEVFSNLGFIREFRQCIQPYQTLIPNDINLFLKANNLHHLNAAHKLDDARIAALKSRVCDLEVNVKGVLETEGKKDGCMNEALIDELREEFGKTNGLIEEFDYFMDSLKCSEDLIAQNEENDLNIDEFHGLNKQFQEIQHSILNASNLIESSKYNHENITKIFSSESILNSISLREIYDTDCLTESESAHVSNEIGRKLKACLDLIDSNSEVNFVDQLI